MQDASLSQRRKQMPGAAARAPVSASSSAAPAASPVLLMPSSSASAAPPLPADASLQGLPPHQLRQLLMLFARRQNPASSPSSALPPAASLLAASLSPQSSLAAAARPAPSRAPCSVSPGRIPTNDEGAVPLDDAVANATGEGDARHHTTQHRLLQPPLVAQAALLAAAASLPTGDARASGRSSGPPAETLLQVLLQQQAQGRAPAGQASARASSLPPSFASPIGPLAGGTLGAGSLSAHAEPPSAWSRLSSASLPRSNRCASRAASLPLAAPSGPVPSSLQGAVTALPAAAAPPSAPVPGGATAVVEPEAAARLRALLQALHGGGGRGEAAAGAVPRASGSFSSPPASQGASSAAALHRGGFTPPESPPSSLSLASAALSSSHLAASASSHATPLAAASSASSSRAAARGASLPPLSWRCDPAALAHLFRSALLSSSRMPSSLSASQLASAGPSSLPRASPGAPAAPSPCSSPSSLSPLPAAAAQAGTLAGLELQPQSPSSPAVSCGTFPPSLLLSSLGAPALSVLPLPPHSLLSPQPAGKDAGAAATALSASSPPASSPSSAPSSYLASSPLSSAAAPAAPSAQQLLCARLLEGLRLKQGDAEGLPAGASATPLVSMLQQNVPMEKGTGGGLASTLSSASLPAAARAFLAAARGGVGAQSDSLTQRLLSQASGALPLSAGKSEGASSSAASPLAGSPLTGPHSPLDSQRLLSLARAARGAAADAQSAPVAQAPASSSPLLPPAASSSLAAHPCLSSLPSQAALLLRRAPGDTAALFAATLAQWARLLVNENAAPKEADEEPRTGSGKDAKKERRSEGAASTPQNRKRAAKAVSAPFLPGVGVEAEDGGGQRGSRARRDAEKKAEERSDREGRAAKKKERGGAAVSDARSLAEARAAAAASLRGRPVRPRGGSRAPPVRPASSPAGGKGDPKAEEGRERPGAARSAASLNSAASVAAAAAAPRPGSRRAAPPALHLVAASPAPAPAPAPAPGGGGAKRKRGEAVSAAKTGASAARARGSSPSPSYVERHPRTAVSPCLEEEEDDDEASSASSPPSAGPRGAKASRAAGARPKAAAAASGKLLSASPAADEDEATRTTLSSSEEDEDEAEDGSATSPVFEGEEKMTAEEFQRASDDVRNIPTFSLAELVRAAVLPVRIEGFHALEEAQLLYGRKDWLRYECPLCDRLAHTPDAYWPNFEHYLKEHWRRRKRLGGYVCFPCRRAHDLSPKALSRTTSSNEASSASSPLSGGAPSLSQGSARGGVKGACQRKKRSRFHFHCPLCPDVFRKFSCLQRHAFLSHPATAADPRLELVPQQLYTPWMQDGDDYTVALRRGEEEEDAGELEEAPRVASADEGADGAEGAARPRDAGEAETAAEAEGELRGAEEGDSQAGDTTTTTEDAERGDEQELAEEEHAKREEGNAEKTAAETTAEMEGGQRGSERGLEAADSLQRDAAGAPGVCGAEESGEPGGQPPSSSRSASLSGASEASGAEEALGAGDRPANGQQATGEEAPVSLSAAASAAEAALQSVKKEQSSADSNGDAPPENEEKKTPVVPQPLRSCLVIRAKVEKPEGSPLGSPASSRPTKDGRKSVKEEKNAAEAASGDAAGDGAVETSDRTAAEEVKKEGARGIKEEQRKAKKRVAFVCQVRVRPLDKELSIMEKLGAVMGPVLTGMMPSSSGTEEGTAGEQTQGEKPAKAEGDAASGSPLSMDFPRRNTRSATAAAMAAERDRHATPSAFSGDSSSAASSSLSSPSSLSSSSASSPSSSSYPSSPPSPSSSSSSSSSSSLPSPFSPAFPSSRPTSSSVSSPSPSSSSSSGSSSSASASPSASTSSSFSPSRASSSSFSPSSPAPPSSASCLYYSSASSVSPPPSSAPASLSHTSAASSASSLLSLASPLASCSSFSSSSSRAVSARGRAVAAAAAGTARRLTAARGAAAARAAAAKALARFSPEAAGQTSRSSSLSQGRARGATGGAREGRRRHVSPLSLASPPSSPSACSSTPSPSSSHTSSAEDSAAARHLCGSQEDCREAAGASPSAPSDAAEEGGSSAQASRPSAAQTGAESVVVAGLDNDDEGEKSSQAPRDGERHSAPPSSHGLRTTLPEDAEETSPSAGEAVLSSEASASLEAAVGPREVPDDAFPAAVSQRQCQDAPKEDDTQADWPAWKKRRREPPPLSRLSSGSPPSASSSPRSSSSSPSRRGCSTGAGGRGAPARVSAEREGREDTEAAGAACATSPATEAGSEAPEGGERATLVEEASSMERPAAYPEVGDLSAHAATGKTAAPASGQRRTSPRTSASSSSSASAGLPSAAVSVHARGSAVSLSVDDDEATTELQVPARAVSRTGQRRSGASEPPSGLVSSAGRRAGSRSPSPPRGVSSERGDTWCLQRERGSVGDENADRSGGGEADTLAPEETRATALVFPDSGDTPAGAAAAEASGGKEELPAELLGAGDEAATSSGHANDGKRRRKRKGGKASPLVEPLACSLAASRSGWTSVLGRGAARERGGPRRMIQQGRRLNRLAMPPLRTRREPAGVPEQFLRLPASLSLAVSATSSPQFHSKDNEQDDPLSVGGPSESPVASALLDRPPHLGSSVSPGAGPETGATGTLGSRPRWKRRSAGRTGEGEAPRPLRSFSSTELLLEGSPLRLRSNQNLSLQRLPSQPPSGALGSNRRRKRHAPLAPEGTSEGPGDNGDVAPPPKNLKRVKTSYLALEGEGQEERQSNGRAQEGAEEERGLPATRRSSKSTRSSRDPGVSSGSPLSFSASASPLASAAGLFYVQGPAPRRTRASEVEGSRREGAGGDEAGRRSDGKHTLALSRRSAEAFLCSTGAAFEDPTQIRRSRGSAASDLGDCRLSGAETRDTQAGESSAESETERLPFSMQARERPPVFRPSVGNEPSGASFESEGECVEEETPGEEPRGSRARQLAPAACIPRRTSN
ncbi:hypothetical protein BESB_058390 [Besnoitia besnoiti]|uniref:C2H2-type domain-containing protein n=1 Tax=Besnoitia besnoiti TaxID=94643 RepID=A0A2A9MHT0_BESBE|nr:hypothetical protein BESB_058390 [Besnoitia besnoiti]PFH34952.1 hypothetical protein BESB_058390 [Besnoitia besnoiti]